MNKKTLLGVFAFLVVIGGLGYILIRFFGVDLSEGAKTALIYLFFALLTGFAIFLIKKVIPWIKHVL